MSWKQLFFERYIAQQLEEFDATSDDVELLRQRVQAGEDYVFQLRVEQLVSHLDLNLVFSHLPNLTSLDLTYGCGRARMQRRPAAAHCAHTLHSIKRVGMRYQRSLYGMKLADATSLAGCIRHAGVLTTLRCAARMLTCALVHAHLTPGPARPAASPAT